MNHQVIEFCSFHYENILFTPSKFTLANITNEQFVVLKEIVKISPGHKLDKRVDQRGSCSCVQGTCPLIKGTTDTFLVILREHLGADSTKRKRVMIFPYCT